MTKKRPILCVVAGPNGSGKTTTTVQLLNNEWAADSLYINPDNIAQAKFGDRAYIYDNSVDNQLPRLLYRTIDGQLFKQYLEEVPVWASMLLK